jgi:hypothetical protein
MIKPDTRDFIKKKGEVAALKLMEHMIGEQVSFTKINGFL